MMLERGARGWWSSRGALLVVAAAMATAWGCTSASASRPTWPQDKKNLAAGQLATPVEERDPATDAGGEAGKVPEASREAVPIEGSDLVHGRSTVEVHAPAAKVRETVLDFGRYPDFMPHYAGARDLGRKKHGAREVYMQWAALHGAIKMWARFDLIPRTEGDAEIWESSFIDGNVKDAYAFWRIEPIDDTRTQLTLEVFLHPKLPLPTDLLNEENLDGAVKGVTAMRKRCEEL